MRNKKLTSFLMINAFLVCSGCSDSIKSQYIVAEQLWSEKKYPAAVREFEGVFRKDAKGDLGLQALFRSAMTDTLYISRHREAVQKLRYYSRTVKDKQLAKVAEFEISNILYFQLRDYESAVVDTEALLKKYPNDPSAPELKLRISKSRLILGQFDQAIEILKEIQAQYRGSIWAERAHLEMANGYFSRGEQRTEQKEHSNVHLTALKMYESFIKQYPNSEKVVEARFGVASCYEEMGRLDQSYELFEAIQSSYPAPKVIQIKLIRLRERMAKRSL